MRKEKTSVLDLNLLLREGVLYKMPLFIEGWSQSNTVVLLRTSCVAYSLLQERAGKGLSAFKVSGELHKLYVKLSVHK